MNVFLIISTNDLYFNYNTQPLKVIPETKFNDFNG